MQANYFLSTNHWDLQAATEAYEAAENQDPDAAADEGSAHPGGGRTLGESGPSSSAQPASGSGQSGGPPRAQKKFATLGDIAAAPHVSDEDSEEDQDFFAGGEKSGLAVQNPDDLKKKIIEKARKYEDTTALRQKLIALGVHHIRAAMHRLHNAPTLQVPRRPLEEMIHHLKRLKTRMPPRKPSHSVSSGGCISGQTAFPLMMVTSMTPATLQMQRSST